MSFSLKKDKRNGNEKKKLYSVDTFLFYITFIQRGGGDGPSTPVSPSVLRVRLHVRVVDTSTGCDDLLVAINKCLSKKPHLAQLSTANHSVFVVENRHTRLFSMPLQKEPRSNSVRMQFPGQTLRVHAELNSHFYAQLFLLRLRRISQNIAIALCSRGATKIPANKSKQRI